MNSIRIEHYLSIAESACMFSDNTRTRVGCVVVYRNSVISVGWNPENKEHPIQKKYNKLRGNYTSAPEFVSRVHAEVMALARIKYMFIDWSCVSVFVCRILKDGTREMARPCAACEAYIRSFGIRNVYYTTAGGYLYERL